MSRENVDTWLALADAYNRGDLDSILERTAPDFEFHTAQLFTDTDAIYRGREGFRDFFETFQSAWQDISVSVERVEDCGDDEVLALFTFQGKGRGSGAEVTVKYAHLAKLRDGLFVRIRGFADWEEAIEAAGLEE
jgi:ketosteroid isomerase-like protein